MAPFTERNDNHQSQNNSWVMISINKQAAHARERIDPWCSHCRGDDTPPSAQLAVCQQPDMMQIRDEDVFEYDVGYVAAHKSLSNRSAETASTEATVIPTTGFAAGAGADAGVGAVNSNNNNSNTADAVNASVTAVSAIAACPTSPLTTSVLAQYEHQLHHTLYTGDVSGWLAGAGGRKLFAVARSSDEQYERSKQSVASGGSGEWWQPAAVHLSQEGVDGDIAAAGALFDEIQAMNMDDHMSLEF